jgi:hypothetical protein
MCTCSLPGSKFTLRFKVRSSKLGGLGFPIDNLEPVLPQTPRHVKGSYCRPQHHQNTDLRLYLCQPQASLLKRCLACLHATLLAACTITQVFSSAALPLSSRHSFGRFLLVPYLSLVAL